MSALSPSAFLKTFDSIFTLKSFDPVRRLPMFKTPEMSEHERRLALAAADIVARYTPSVWRLRRRLSRRAL